MLLKIIFEFVPGHCTVVLRRHLLRSFILFYLTGADCINRLIQCNTGSLKHWNFDLSSSVSFVSHCTSSPESLWDSCNLFFFSGSSFWDLLYACKWAFPALSMHILELSPALSSSLLTHFSLLFFPSAFGSRSFRIILPCTA